MILWSHIFVIVFTGVLTAELLVSIAASHQQWWFRKFVNPIEVIYLKLDMGINPYLKDKKTDTLKIHYSLQLKTSSLLSF